MDTKQTETERQLITYYNDDLTCALRIMCIMYSCMVPLNWLLPAVTRAISVRYGTRYSSCCWAYL